MKKIILIVNFLFFGLMLNAQTPSPKLYEMRVYYSPEGKLETLLGRFRDHTTKLFEKHGMENIGYWLPIDNKENKLVYILAFPNKEARDLSWKNFGTDPEWKKVQAATEANGKIVSKVESTFMTETDFSKLNISNEGNRVFELRIYKTTKYNLGLLLARFRNHTVDLFTKHGMTNLVYFTQNGVDDTLIYLLAHKSKEAGLASFNSFRVDPDWVAARDASEKLAKGSLTVSVKSEYMVPTDFSTWK
ncbi:MAG: NIPSNAP family protein [Bacteroidota bacterium]